MTGTWQGSVLFDIPLNGWGYDGIVKDQKISVFLDVSAIKTVYILEIEFAKFLDEVARNYVIEKYGEYIEEKFYEERNWFKSDAEESIGKNKSRTESVYFIENDVLCMRTDFTDVPYDIRFTNDLSKVKVPTGFPFAPYMVLERIK